MAGQTSAQKAAAERAAAEKGAAEQAAAERKAAEKAASARAEAANPQGPAVPAAEPDTAAEPDRTLYTVTGAAVVLRTDDGFERYLYRGAVVDGAAFSQASIDHAISNNLVAGTD